MELREEILEVFYDNTTFGEKADAILALVAEDRVALMRRAKEAEHDSDTFEAAFKQAEAREVALGHIHDCTACYTCSRHFQELEAALAGRKP
jgi:hypothetical protein